MKGMSVGMKPMLPSLTFEIPEGNDWFYEVKYDGFRAILEWDREKLQLTSRNGKPLLDLFPEIGDFLLSNRTIFEKYLPFVLDGELVFLENADKANFGFLQIRGRMRSAARILEKASHSPCRLVVFDLLELKGQPFNEKEYYKRKEALTSLFQSLDLPLSPDEKTDKLLQLIPANKSFGKVWEKVVLHDGEGVVAKKKSSRWEEGKRTTSWVKYKNWKYLNCFLTAYDKSNGYFFVGVYKADAVFQLGSFIFGLKPDEKQALFQIIKENKTKEEDQFIYVDPAICVEIKYLEIYEEQLREPHFHRFRFDLEPKDCTYGRYNQQQKNLPQDVEITNPEKPLWKFIDIQKIDYIHYLREISPYMLPFLKERLLTVIRYPHGMFGEPFYQKNCPDYAPEFIDTHMEEGINYIVCNNLKTFMWLGNQLAIEFHIPFQTIHSNGPSEIVLDLDPPSRAAFPLAIKAAILIKDVLDQLQLISFIKTSGNKGLQIYLPLPENRFSYDETRLFTSFIAEYLVSKDPDSFTIERMKKNRGNRLYVDYVQHAEGKTIIAPYSVRGNENATVATPLYWEEVNKSLSNEAFQFPTIMKRLKNQGCPFQAYFQAKEQQNFAPVLEFLTTNQK